MATHQTGTNGAEQINEDRYQDDNIVALGGNDTINLYVNDDFGGENTVSAGDGNDFVFNDSEGGNIIDLGNGDDLYVGQGYGTFTLDNVHGGAGNDQFYVATFHSNYAGGEGSDNFYSAGWQNSFDGGAGDDMISYEYAEKAVNIGLDINTVYTGTTRKEYVYNVEHAAGSNFSDEIYGDAGRNYLYGKGGNDQMDGLAGDDYVGGGEGNDTVSGGNGNDWVFGDEGADLMSGGAGYEYMYGGTGNDTMSGGADWDWIEGAAGADQMTGGTGSDFFIFRSISDSGLTTTTRDTITDFVRGTDKIDLSLIDANLAIAGDQAFTLVSSFTGAAGQVSIARAATTIVSLDLNGDRAVDMSFALTGNLALTVSDFIL